MKPHQQTCVRHAAGPPGSLCLPHVHKWKLWWDEEGVAERPKGRAMEAEKQGGAAGYKTMQPQLPEMPDVQEHVQELVHPRA
eukprot:g344.t1